MRDYEKKGNRCGVLNYDPRYLGVEEGGFLIPDQHGLYITQAQIQPGKLISTVSHYKNE